jgi:hypothetical protein
VSGDRMISEGSPGSRPTRGNNQKQGENAMSDRMDADELFAAVFSLFLICVTVVGSVAIVSSYKTKAMFVEAGYVQTMLPGYPGHSWVKP